MRTLATSGVYHPWQTWTCNLFSNEGMDTAKDHNWNIVIPELRGYVDAFMIGADEIIDDPNWRIKINFTFDLLIVYIRDIQPENELSILSMVKTLHNSAYDVLFITKSKHTLEKLNGPNLKREPMFFEQPVRYTWSAAPDVDSIKQSEYPFFCSMVDASDERLKFKDIMHGYMGVAIDSLEKNGVEPPLLIYSGYPPKFEPFNEIHFIGMVSVPTLMQSLANASAFISPYGEDQFPNTAIEACGIGIPTLVRDTEMNREIFGEDYIGYYKSSVEIHEKLTEILEEWDEVSPKYWMKSCEIAQTYSFTSMLGLFLMQLNERLDYSD